MRRINEILSFLVLFSIVMPAYFVFASWERSQVNTTDPNDYFSSVMIGAARNNDSIIRVYATNRVAGYVYEYTWNGLSWDEMSFSGVGGDNNTRFYALDMGDVRNNGEKHLVAGNRNTNCYDEFYSGGWVETNMGGNPDYIYDVAVGNGRNNGTNNVYTACADDNIYEFYFNGSNWEAPVIVGSPGSMAFTGAVAVGAARNGSSTNFVYGGGGNGNALYEFYYNGTSFSWMSLGAVHTFANNVNVIVIGQGREGSTDTCLYAGISSGSLWEFLYNGFAWQGNSINANSTSAINGIALGNGRNDGVKRLYYSTSSGAIFEMSWAGTFWSAPASLGSTSTLPFRGLALGPGRNGDPENRLYTGSGQTTGGGDGEIYEYHWIAPTLTPTPSISVTHTPSLTPTESATISKTPTISETPTITPTLTNSVTHSCTPTITSTPSITPTLTITPTATNSRVFTTTPTFTITRTSTITLTSTVTPTASITPTPTRTRTFTQTRTITISPTISPTSTRTPLIVAPADLSRLVVYPNPYRGDINRSGQVVFQNVPWRATIRLYDISGSLVRTLQKDSNLPSVAWDLKNDGGGRVASGVYIFIIKTAKEERRGKVLIAK